MKIDLADAGDILPPFLFGHNLEHTRSAIWRGLSAQILVNRKFAGGPSTIGVARGWEPIGPEESWYSVRQTLAPVNYQDEAYVYHHSLVPSEQLWDSGRQRQMIAGSTADFRRGISQSGLDLAGGQEYECRVVLSSLREMEVEIAVQGSAGAIAVTDGTAETGADHHYNNGERYYADFASVGGEWMSHEFRFVAPKNDTNACLDITFTGRGILFVGATALLSAGHLHGMRRDVVDLLKEMSSPILRWPGGNFAGSYVWKDGLLPVDRRAPVNAGAGTLLYSSGWDDHEIGTDEFISLCREIGAEPWITLNLSNGSVEEIAADARDWVEYCNGKADTKWGAIRAERGHPEPYGVTYWSLGNEMGYGHMRGPNTPEAYGAAADACAHAMRGTGATLTLVASGTWWKEEWFPVVIPKYGTQYDYISFHEYTDPMKSFWGDEGRAEFNRIATDSERLAGKIELVRERLQKHSPDGKYIAISFDEWNTWQNWFRNSGIADGIFAASVLSMVCRESSRLGLTMGAFFEPVNEGGIDVSPHSSRLTPIGQVHRLFSGHHGRRLIPTGEVSANTQVVLVVTTNATPDAWRAREDGRDIYITAVNRSCDEPAAVEFDFSFAGRDGGSGVGGANESPVGSLLVDDTTVLTSPGFEPGSVFDQAVLEPIAATRAKISFTLPQHSVCGVRLHA